MEILLFLLGLAIAAALVIGWFIGSAFVAVMASLPIGAVLVLMADKPNYLIGCVVILAVIWTPCLIRHVSRAY